MGLKSFTHQVTPPASYSRPCPPDTSQVRFIGQSFDHILVAPIYPQGWSQRSHSNLHVLTASVDSSVRLVYG